MRGITITIYYEHTIPYVATIHNNAVSIHIPTLKETHDRQ